MGVLQSETGLGGRGKVVPLEKHLSSVHSLKHRLTKRFSFNYNIIEVFPSPMPYYINRVTLKEL